MVAQGERGAFWFSDSGHPELPAWISLGVVRNLGWLFSA
jgi:hypothetical protein